MFSSIDVHNRLQELEIPHEIFKLPRATASLEQAAEAVGLDLDQLVKVAVYRVDGEPIAVIIPASMKVDLRKLREVCGGGEPTPVASDELTTLTGYISSAVPPVGHKTAMPVYIDFYALREDVVYTGSGDPTAILKIRSYDLVRATGAETVDLAVSPE